MAKKKKNKIPRSNSKKRSFDKPQLRGDIMSVLRSSPDKQFNYKQISSRLDITDSEARKMVLLILNELSQSEMVEQPSRGKFSVHPSQVAKITARMDFTKTGSAYAIPESGSDDIFIAEKNTGVALHGDTVEISILGMKRGQPEGKVVNVVTRSAENYVGVIEMSKNHAFLIPSNPRIHTDFYIDKSKINGAKDGEKVIVKILDWDDPKASPFAEVVSVLGQPGVNEVEMHAILVEFGLPFEFPDNVLAAAEKIDIEITEEEISRRKDFRDFPTFTIDPEDAKDFDDALSVRPLKDGLYEVGVHIADVSHYVKEGDIIDEEAIKRATSVYLVDRVVPMLPEVLSNYVCSLRPNEEKLAMSAVFHINDKGKVEKEWFGRTVIKSNRRYTYEQAQEVIEGKEDEFSKEILMLHKWAQQYRRDRIAQGALEFSGVEIKFKLDEKGKPIGVYEKVMRESNFLIEEFMLLANKRVAAFIGDVKDKEKQKTFVYRIHDLPDPEKLKLLQEFVAHLGYKLKSAKPENASYALNDLMKQVKDKPEEDVVKIMAIRSMAKAVYSTENIGHYGLSFDFYTHFTSPIRRYPDVMVHRLLERYSSGEKSANKEEIEKRCVHSSNMEKKAADAERASIKYKQVEFMMDKIGEHFTGYISGLTRWGMFVELEDTKVEGMVPLSTLEDDVYKFEEKKNRIIGTRYKEVYEFGDKVRVKVHGADLLMKQLDFRLV